MKDLIIVGAGGFGREVAWLIENINEKENQYNIMGYVDDNKDIIGKTINGYKVIGDSDYLIEISKKNEIYGVISVQNARVKKIFEKKLIDIHWETLIHPSVIMAATVEIGMGSIITAGNIITTNVFIGKHCLLNLSCTVGHDCILEDYVSVMPGCNLSGFTKLKEGCWIGTGVKVIPSKEIGRNSIIGAGSIVIKNIPDNCTAVGNPAKPIKFNE